MPKDNEQPNPKGFLLNVWRDACRHLELAESAQRIAQQLAPRLGGEVLLVRRVDLEHRRLDTVAVGAFGDSSRPHGTRLELTPPQLRTLLSWFATGEVRSAAPGGGDAIIDIVAPTDTRGEVLAGPLGGEDGPTGVLVVVAPRGKSFTADDGRLVSALLEPFSVALANNEHFHELARLRERLEADNRALLSRLDRQDVMDSIVGHDAGLSAVMARVEQVAPTDAPVLLLGETGTGKEVISRAIHARSSRAKGPMVRVNCGALPPGLVDSELFGHERGSFTGAIAARKGWFERADGGTLFLDEVAELPLDAQVRFLRILQDGTFERVGGQRMLSADVRVVAATHRDLQSLVARRAFREDLWYRLGVFPIRLPPLRERIEDIPALAAHFAGRVGLRLGGAPLSVSTHDVGLLVAYAWPGNVRELASVIERAAIIGDGRELQIAAALGLDHVPAPEIRRSTSSAISDRPSLEHDASLITLDSVARRHIEEALSVSGGRIEGRFGAAEKLGINPHTLRARMRRLGVDWKKFRGSRTATGA